MIRGVHFGVCRRGWIISELCWNGMGSCLGFGLVVCRKNLYLIASLHADTLSVFVRTGLHAICSILDLKSASLHAICSISELKPQI